MWKNGLHVENGETFFYTKARKFCLRMLNDDVIGYYPFWAFHSMNPSYREYIDSGAKTKMSYEDYLCSNKS